MDAIRTTIRDIAKTLSVHHSTVSRALRNDRRLPQTTRDRVVATAEKMGYRPDPMLSALMEYRSSRTQKKYQATLAWITNFSTRDAWNHYERTAYYRGACARANKLGYKVEEFWLGEMAFNQRRATQILVARNIQGLLFIPQPRSRAHLSLDWNKFSAVTFGRTLARPRFHNISHDHYRSFAFMMRQLKRLGYRKPGLVSVPRIEESVERTWRAAFAAYQVLPSQKQIPLFVHRPATFVEFRTWLMKYLPDVVISSDETIFQWIKEIGFKVPEEVGFVLSAKHAESAPELAGIIENNELVGETAVEILVQMINRGERGSYKESMSTLIEGQWSPGKTLRATIWERLGLKPSKSAALAIGRK